MSEIQEDIQEVVASKISRRRFVQGAAAVTAGAAVVGLAACGDSSSGGSESKALRIATGKQEHVAAPWETSCGSLFILRMVVEWLTLHLHDGSLEPRLAESWESS